MHNSLLPLTSALLLPAAIAHAAPPALMLAQSYNQSAQITLSDYLVSEKLDGVRGYWTGDHFISRSGLTLPVPARLTRQLPNVPLDGELWLGHGQFSATAALLRSNDADNPLWQQLTYQVFDLPTHRGEFATRYQVLKRLLPAADPFVHLLAQTPASDSNHLAAHLHRVVTAGGEGLMLHNRYGHYEQGRSHHLLKDKPFDDAEGEVIGYRPGKGKYRGEVGALIVQLEDGKRIGLGSGLSDYDREHPPAVGTQVTFRYNGLTRHGKPRFARFLRVRDQAL